MRVDHGYQQYLCAYSIHWLFRGYTKYRYSSYGNINDITQHTDAFASNVQSISYKRDQMYFIQSNTYGKKSQGN
jgi:hypothetical protein